jgi:hypothetical protein
MSVNPRFFLILIIVACMCYSCVPTPQLDPETEEYAVYSDLMESKFKRGNVEQVLIFSQTRVGTPELLEMDLADFQEYTPLAPELVTSFMDRNQQPHPLERLLDLDIEYQLFTQEQLDELQAEDEASDWKLFYEKYSNTVGFIYFSRVGFNADLSQALVSYSQYHYDQPITGGYYLMVRQDGQWTVEASYAWDS